MISRTRADVTGVILAGGNSTRMGVVDKCLLPVAGKPMLEHVIQRAKPQVTQLLLSANGDPVRFAHFGLPIVTDIYPNLAGPLAGVISAMSIPSTAHWLATFPCDTPLAPDNWVATLRDIAEANQLDVVFAADNLDKHYAFSLWSYRRLAHLKTQFAAGQRSLHRAIASLNSQAVICHQHSQSFFNINTPEDLQRLTEQMDKLNDTQSQI